MDRLEYKELRLVYWTLADRLKNIDDEGVQCALRVLRHLSKVRDLEAQRTKKSKAPALRLVD